MTKATQLLTCSGFAGVTFGSWFCFPLLSNVEQFVLGLSADSRSVERRTGPPPNRDALLLEKAQKTVVLAVAARGLTCCEETRITLMIL